MELVLNTSVFIVAAKGLDLNHDSNWLSDSSGYVKLTTHWAKAMLQILGFSKLRVTTEAGLTSHHILKSKGLDVQSIREMQEFPIDLVLNWDQTSIHYVPVCDWTMENQCKER